ncbi:nuclear transport factor 2 family protein [Solibacillus sp. FSL R5-0691]|uniref:nuclear transport factor 2 family protein n=1 Tax=Solibacillus sp. FSL R5-0691 TaxID=2921653 RepID=UPI0030D5527B
MKKWLVAVLAVFVLAACGNEQEASPENLQKTIDEGTVGFEMMGDSIQEEADVPEEEKNNIISAFNEYIAAFNEKDLERYKNIISKNASGFNYDEDIEAVSDVFNQYDVKRTAEDITIVKYSEDEAQVFSNLTTETKEIDTGAELSGVGRQVTVLKKEDGWKVSSIYYIGSE